MARHLDGGFDRAEVVSVRDSLGVPAVGIEALGHVLRPGHRRRPIELDVVVVVQDDQLAQVEVAGEARGLGRDALLEIAVGSDDVRPVVDDHVLVTVELGRQPALGDGHADSIREALTERPGRRFHPGRQAVLRVSRRARPPLSERLEVVEREVVARSGGGASRAACWRGRRRARSGRGPAIPGSSGRGAGTGSTARRPSAPRPSGRPGARSSPAGRRPSRGSGWCRSRGGRGRASRQRSSGGTPARAGRWSAIVGRQATRAERTGACAPILGTHAEAARPAPSPTRPPVPSRLSRAGAHRGAGRPACSMSWSRRLGRSSARPTYPVGSRSSRAGRPRTPPDGSRAWVRGRRSSRRSAGTRWAVPLSTPYAVTASRCGSSAWPARGPVASASSSRPTASGPSWPIGAPPFSSDRRMCDPNGSPGPTGCTCRCTRSWANRWARPPDGRCRWPATRARS